MTMIYSDPARESEPNALPNVEVFYAGTFDAIDMESEPGWYWWHCFPGCLPDTQPIGPFDSEEEAIKDARDFSHPNELRGQQQMRTFEQLVEIARANVERHLADIIADYDEGEDESKIYDAIYTLAKDALADAGVDVLDAVKVAQYVAMENMP